MSDDSGNVGRTPTVPTEAPPPPQPKPTTAEETTTKKTTTTTTTEKPTSTNNPTSNVPVPPTSTGAKGPAESHSIPLSPSSQPLSPHTSGTDSSAPASTSFAALPISKGDEALFGRTATVGGFDMTAGILIYGSFVVLFVAAVGFATMHRLKSRRALRLRKMAMQENGKGDDGESGGGGRSLPRGLVGGVGGIGKEEGRYMDEDLKLEFGDDGNDSDDAGAARKDAYTAAPDRKYTYPDREALYKNASMSRKALISDAAPTGTSPSLGAAATKSEDTPSARAAKRASSASTASTRSKRLSSVQTYDIYTSGSRGGVAAAAVAALDRPKAAISNPVVRFEETDSITGSILISCPRPVSNTSSIISSSDIEDMTSYSPEPVHLIVYDGDTDSQSDYSSSPPHNIPKITVPPQTPNTAYQSRGQQGYLNPTQSSTLQQKRQSPPPPPKSLKRLSPVSTTALAKNFQQAQTIASTVKLGPTKTTTAPITSTAPLARSNTLRTGFTPTPRGANSTGLKRSSSASVSSNASSLASSRTGRSGNIYYNASHYGRNEFSPAERKIGGEEVQYPTPIMRSNSVRLPMEMRKGGAGAVAGATGVGYNSNDANNYF